MEDELDQKEREIATKLLDDDYSFPEGASVPEDLLFWATKLIALVDANDPRVDDLYKVLRYCIHCDMRDKELCMVPPSPLIETPRAWGPGYLRELERWERAYRRYGADARLSADRAARLVASIKGVRIDLDALVPERELSPLNVLKAAYHCLVAQIQAPGL